MNDIPSSAPSSPSPRRMRSGWINLLLLTGSTLLVLLLLEIGVRVLAPQPLFVYRFSPATWYEPTPDRAFVYPRPEFRQAVQYNEYGLRDRSVTLAKPAGTVRIVVIGDSYTEGLEVELAATMCKRLEAILNETGAGPVEVLNLGVSGFSPIQSVRRLLDLGLGFEPDQVVFLASQNDFDDNLAQPTRGLCRFEGDSLIFVDARIGPARRFGFAVKDFLKSHFMSYQFVRARLQSLPGGRRSPEVTSNDPTPTGVPPGNAVGAREPPAGAVTAMRLTLKRLRHECDARGIRLTAAMVTNKTADHPHSWVPAFARLCRETGVPFVDLRPTFRELEASGVRGFFVIDGHWNPTGHDAAARALAGVVGHPTTSSETGEEG